MQAFVVVKGSIAQAMQSAMIRGFEPVNFRDGAAGQTYGELFADAAKLNAWFCEPGECKPVTGHDVGSLLFWRPLTRSMVG